MAGATMRRADVEALPWQPVDSSNVARVAFVPEHEKHGEQEPTGLGALYIEFHGGSGRVYRYADVRQEQHAELLEADSVGGYLNAEVKGSHEHERIEVVRG